MTWALRLNAGDLVANGGAVQHVGFKTNVLHQGIRG